MKTYLELINEKEELQKELKRLVAKEFGATSMEEMDWIKSRRVDIHKAIGAINKQLSDK